MGRGPGRAAGRGMSHHRAAVISRMAAMGTGCPSGSSAHGSMAIPCTISRNTCTTHASSGPRSASNQPVERSRQQQHRRHGHGHEGEGSQQGREQQVGGDAVGR